MSSEITRTIVEEGTTLEDPTEVCEAYLKKHGISITVSDNRHFRHNESKLMQVPKYIASAAGWLRDGYGDTPEEAIDDFKKTLLEGLNMTGGPQ